MLSEHFGLDELTFSSTGTRLGYLNVPDAAAIHNLTLLCSTCLEPARALLNNLPWHVDSGYRSRLVNLAVGGAHDSAHMDGRAADIIPKGIALREAFDILRKSELIQFDQLIFEHSVWIHIAIAREGEKPRRQALIPIPNTKRYELVT